MDPTIPEPEIVENSTIEEDLAQKVKNSMNPNYLFADISEVTTKGVIAIHFSEDVRLAAGRNLTSFNQTEIEVSIEAAFNQYNSTRMLLDWEAKSLKKNVLRLQLDLEDKRKISTMADFDRVYVKFKNN